MFLANKKNKNKKGPLSSVQSRAKPNQTPTEPKARGQSLAAPTALPTSEPQSKWGWEKSWAKEILRLAIIHGDITDKHTYDEIHVWHPEVEKTDRTKLGGRVRGLRAQLAEDDKAAKEDDLALQHDRKLFPIRETNYRGEPRWPGSVAERLLKQDIKEGKHLAMAPLAFYDSRDEYKLYSTDVIRAHIYQEVKLQKYYLYRNDAKEKSLLKFNK